MIVIHEIQQVMYVETPHGDGQPLFLIDYGAHMNTVWVVANCANGKIRHYESNQIALTINHTLEINTENINKEK